MAKVLISLVPLAVAREEKHPSGVSFTIAPLTGEREAELKRESTNLMGVYDPDFFTEKVCAEVIKGWQGFGVNGAEVQCTPENLKTFIKHHSQSFGPWVVMKARSFDHYRAAEVEEGKKD